MFSLFNAGLLQIYYHKLLPRQASASATRYGRGYGNARESRKRYSWFKIFRFRLSRYFLTSNRRHTLSSVSANDNSEVTPVGQFSSQADTFQDELSNLCASSINSSVSFDPSILSANVPSSCEDFMSNVKFPLSVSELISSEEFTSTASFPFAVKEATDAGNSVSLFVPGMYQNGYLQLKQPAPAQNSHSDTTPDLSINENLQNQSVLDCSEIESTNSTSQFISGFDNISGHQLEQLTLVRPQLNLLSHSLQLSASFEPGNLPDEDVDSRIGLADAIKPFVCFSGEDNI